MAVPTTVVTLPGGLKWNYNKDIPDNTRKHQFTRVRSGHNKVSYISLSGAEQMWKKSDPAHSNTVYILRVPASIYRADAGPNEMQEVRLAGTPEDLRRVLMNMLGNEQVVEAFMQYQINPQNYQGVFKEVVDAEIAARSAYKKAQSESKATPLPLEVLLGYGSPAMIKSAVVTHGTSAHPGFGPRRSQNIAEMLQSVLPGGSDYNVGDLKIVDVSKMDINTGHGAKKVKQPKEGGTSRKFRHELFPGIMSSDYDRYAAAVKMLYPEQAASASGQQVLNFFAQQHNMRMQQQAAFGGMSAPIAWGAVMQQPAQAVPVQPQFMQQPVQSQFVQAAPAMTLPGAVMTAIPRLVNQ